MNLTSSEVSIIAARRGKGDTWKVIAHDLRGSPDPKALRKRFVRAGGNAQRDKLAIVLPNIRIADEHLEWLKRQALSGRRSVAATIRNVIADAMARAP